MLFTRPPRAAEDIRSFCARFNEGLRVEYKANLDDAVRRALPKVISSFANSLGGVLVLGVNAVNGVPQEPI
jgi:predicted HTH transcriptional regulator